MAGVKIARRGRLHRTWKEGMRLFSDVCMVWRSVFDENAGARKYGGSTSRDVQISHRRRIERRISLDLCIPEMLSDVTRERG